MRAASFTPCRPVSAVVICSVGSASASESSTKIKSISVSSMIRIFGPVLVGATAGWPGTFGEREVAQGTTRYSCFHPRAEKRLHGRAEFHQLERFFEKLQRAISSTFRRQFRSNPGRDEQDTRLGQNTPHFAEERDRARMWRSGSKLSEK